MGLERELHSQLLRGPRERFATRVEGGTVFDELQPPARFPLVDLRLPGPVLIPPQKTEPPLPGVTRACRGNHRISSPASVSARQTSSGDALMSIDIEKRRVFVSVAAAPGLSDVGDMLYSSFCSRGSRVAGSGWICALAAASEGGTSGRGCPRVTRRNRRPRGEASSWYFATSSVMQSESSLAKAARDSGDAKRISESMVSVERRLCSARARASSVETSVMVRAATATTYEAE